MSAVNEIWENLALNESKTENADNQALTPMKAVTLLTITDIGIPTLASGGPGLLKAVYAVAVTSGKSAAVTPASVYGFTSVTLNAVGEWVIFKWDNNAWTIADSGGGATVNTS